MFNSLPPLPDNVNFEKSFGTVTKLFLFLHGWNFHISISESENLAYSEFL